MEWTAAQIAAIEADGTTLLLGPAGSGKSTALRQRLVSLLAAGETAYTLLVLIAEPEHENQFLDTLHAAGLGPYAELRILTFNRLAQEMVTLFWPLVARPAGFERPYQPPTILNYDLAQLLMWDVLDRMLTEGAFANLRLRPQQIVSQLLDTLNRAALNGLTLEEATERQIATWAGEPERVHHLQEALAAARRFRRECFQRSLLDLSLVIDVFNHHVLGHHEFRRYFSERFRHLLVDNVEEQTPVGQRFVSSMLTATVSTTVAYDARGGYKRFLAADPRAATRFEAATNTTIRFEEVFTATTAVTHLANMINNYLHGSRRPTEQAAEGVLATVGGRYRREMVANLVPLLRDLVADGVAPRDIAIITPYLDGALRYTLEQALTEVGLPYFLSRRRSSPREEPQVRAWLTWLTLAHPDWGLAPNPYDVAEALTLSLQDVDPARAALVVTALYNEAEGRLAPVETTPGEVVARVGEATLAQVARLREWLEANEGEQAPDRFLNQLFHELLSQPPFKTEPDLAAAAVCDWLVRTAGRLRAAGDAIGWATPAAVGATLVNGIYQGLVAANPPDLGAPPDEDGIMIATIYGYLLTGRAMRVQVWLETAASGWWDIPRQPLSNAFVLAESRPADLVWDGEEEIAVRRELLGRIVDGLANRCTGGVVLATSALDRRGQRQDGIMWRALQPVIGDVVV